MLLILGKIPIQRLCQTCLLLMHLSYLKEHGLFSNHLLMKKLENKISILGSGYQKELFTYVDPMNVPSILGGKCTCSEYEGVCLHSDIGPWHEYPGDEFGEAAKQKLLEEEKKEEVPIPIPVPLPAPISGII